MRKTIKEIINECWKNSPEDEPLEGTVERAMKIYAEQEAIAFAQTITNSKVDYEVMQDNYANYCNFVPNDRETFLRSLEVGDMVKVYYPDEMRWYEAKVMMKAAERGEIALFYTHNELILNLKGFQQIAKLV